MSLLSAKGLSKHYGGLKAVDEVDFELQKGEVRAIIGPNGAGKTTLVSLLCGRLEVTAGTITFEDHDITLTPAYQRARRGIADAGRPARRRGAGCFGAAPGPGNRAPARDGKP